MATVQLEYPLLKSLPMDPAVRQQIQAMILDFVRNHGDLTPADRKAMEEDLTLRGLFPDRIVVGVRTPDGLRVVSDFAATPDMDLELCLESLSEKHIENVAVFFPEPLDVEDWVSVKNTD